MTNEKITAFKNRNNNRNSKGGSVRLGIYKIKDKVKLNPDHDLGIKDITQPSTTDDTGPRIIKLPSLSMSQKDTIIERNSPGHRVSSSWRWSLEHQNQGDC